MIYDSYTTDEDVDDHNNNKTTQVNKGDKVMIWQTGMGGGRDKRQT